MGRTVKEHAQLMRYLTRPRDVFPDPSSMVPGPRNMYNQGQLVQPSGDGSRSGYSGDAIKLPDSPDAGTKSLGDNVYEVTSKKGFKTYFGKVRDKKKSFGKNKKAAENFVKQELAKPDTRELKKSVIDIQSESGTLLEQPKYKANLTKALDEVTALQEKGYGNIDEIVKKYQKIFTQKIGSKNIQGKTVTTGVGSTEYKGITFAINEHAKKLGIQSIKNENVIKALNAYSKIKNPKRGDIPKILKRYNAPEGSFNRYLQENKLNLRKKIPLQFGSEVEKKKYYYRLRRDAINEFSSKKFERFFSAPETALVQKSHLGDLYNQYVRTGNLGYAPNLINQETLKDVDAALKEYNEQINDLFENKPKGYRNKIDLLNQKGNDLAAATQGYKKFTGRDPFTGKEFTINFSRPNQELDPGDLYGNKKLSELSKADKITGVYDPKTETYKKVNIPLLEDMKKQSMKAAKLSKKKTTALDKQITENLKDLNEAEKTRLASMGGKGCNGNFAPGGPVPNKIRCITKALDRLKNPENLGPGDKANVKRLFQSAGAKKFGNFLKGFGIPGEIVFEAAFAIPAFLRGESGKRILGDTILGFIGAGQSSEEEFVEYAKKKGLSDPTIELISDVNRIVDLGSSITKKETIGKTSMYSPTELYNLKLPRGMRNVYKAEVDETNSIFDKHTMDQPQAPQIFDENMFSNAMQLGLDVEDDVQADKDKRIKEREEMGIISNQNYGSFNQVPTGIMGAYKKYYE